MYSYLIAVLFALLALSSPLPCDHTPSPTPTPTDDCTPTTTPSYTPTDDCSDYIPSTTTPTATPTSSTTRTGSIPINADASNGPFTGGVATYFYQNGNPGACGQYNSDNAMICAMDQARFGTSGPASPLCGHQVRITNMNNNWTATVTIADDCPTCENANSIDLSVDAFQALEPDLSVGEFPISWEYV